MKKKEGIIIINKEIGTTSCISYDRNIKAIAIVNYIHHRQYETLGIRYFIVKSFL